MREFVPFNPFEGTYAGQLRTYMGTTWRWTTTGIFRPHWLSVGPDVTHSVLVFPPQYEDDVFTVGVKQGEEEGYCTVMPEKWRSAETFRYANRLRRGELITPSGEPINST